MKVIFEGNLKEVVKEMEDFINQTNIENDEKEVIELTDNLEDLVSIQQLKQHCNKLGISYTKLKYDYNLSDTRIRHNGKQMRVFRGVKLVDN